MKIESNPERILLNLHTTTRARMNAASLPLGVTRTKWINDAICEKLDRDQPHTILGHGEVQKIDSYAILAEMKQKQVLKNPLAWGPYSWSARGTSDGDMGMFNHKRKSKLGTSLGLEGETKAWMIQDPAKVLTEEQEREIMADYHAHQAKLAALPPVPAHMIGHPRQIAAWREAGSPVEALAQEEQAREYSDTAEYLELCKSMVKTAKLAEDEEDDFWGGYDKIKSAARK